MMKRPSRYLTIQKMMDWTRSRRLTMKMTRTRSEGSEKRNSKSRGVYKRRDREKLRNVAEKKRRSNARIGRSKPSMIARLPRAKR